MVQPGAKSKHAQHHQGNKAERNLLSRHWHRLRQRGHRQNSQRHVSEHCNRKPRQRKLLHARREAKSGAQGRIRTSVARKERQIYSLLPLTTRPPVRNLARRRAIERRPPCADSRPPAEHATSAKTKTPEEALSAPNAISRF